MASRAFSLVGSRDQWLRCAHAHTRVDADGVVGLAWTEVDTPGTPPSGPEPPVGGLAFDRRCRLYRSLPEEGRVVRSRWTGGEAGLPGREPPPEVVDVLAPPPVPDAGDFAPAAPAGGALDTPLGVAVTDDDRLFVAEAGARRVVVLDLWRRTLLRTIPTSGRPVDLATLEGRVLALLEGDGGLLELSARELVRLLPLVRGPGEGAPPPPRAAARLAVAPDGRLAVLDGAGGAVRVVLLERDPEPPDGAPRYRTVASLGTPGGRDLAFDGDGGLVVARARGRPFLAVGVADGVLVARPPLRAPAYDGRGIVTAPDGRVGYGTDRGLRHALPARVRYAPAGRVVTFRLDGGAYRLQWGRLFLDACVPEGTRVRVRCATADEIPSGPLLERTPPELGGGGALPGVSPPMPPVALLDGAGEPLPLHRRETGRETPWAEAAGDGFRTLEAPAAAPPGRYLWVALELEGNGRAAPRVRSLRVERPGHDLLERLPAVLSREPDTASFLQRYLAMADGMLAGLESRAWMRHVLLDSRSAPAEVLPWLAGFVGLVLDERWLEAARRTAVAEAMPLFRARGTLPGLQRFVEIYTGPPVVIVEHFRLRGMGGALVGDEGPAASSSVLGGGLRVGGAVAEPGTRPLEGTPADAFRSRAHRFSLILPRVLDGEQLDVVRRILEVHRPAHTLFQVCTVEAGMGVGRGLHVGLSSIVGQGGGFRPLTVGEALGRRAVVGRPEPGARVGGAHLGRDTEVG